jgi:cardiolipin synthase
MNISQRNVLIENKKRAVSDITFRIEGAVIDQISQIFEDDWLFVKGEIFEAYSNFVKYDTCEKNIPARIIPDGPDIRQSRIQFLVNGAINFASKSIAIITPYFLPEYNILIALEMAAMRGINVEIIIPDENDHKILGWAQESNLASLIEKGVKVYRKCPPFEHSKIFVIDDIWAFIGSANWDVRSFRLNFESDMELFNRNFALELLEIIESKKASSHLMTIESCRQISFLRKIRNNALRLLTPYF